MKITRAADIDKHKIVLDGCMVTYSGIVFDLMNPDPDLIFIEDIAHQLSCNMRWNGATRRPYSVAEHCIRMSDKLMPDERKAVSALFHDAEEAYWGDIIKPLKEIIKINSPEVIQKMKDLRMLIFDKFKIEYVNLNAEDWSELQWEFETLVLDNNHKPMIPVYAEYEFLWRSKVLLKL